MIRCPGRHQAEYYGIVFHLPRIQGGQFQRDMYPLLEPGDLNVTILADHHECPPGGSVSTAGHNRVHRDKVRSTGQKNKARAGCASSRTIQESCMTGKVFPAVS